MRTDSFLVSNILFSCDKQKKYADEQIVTHHVLGYIVSGKLEMNFLNQHLVAEPGNIALIRKNELVKVVKVPDENGKPFKAINIFFDENLLRNYALQHQIPHQEKYGGNPIIDFSSNKFIRAYWDSLFPYFEEPNKLSAKMAELKTIEAIELLLSAHPEIQQLLFDLNEPHKIDLEKHMTQNFSFNIPLAEFARLSGRSLSTFNRDFKKIFSETPEKWLLNRRLEEAKFLLTEKHQKPNEVYYSVGFENFSHFSDSFKKRFGMNASAISLG